MVGMEDMDEKIKKGEMKFEVVIDYKDEMRVVGKMGKVMGKRGMMKKKKVGNVKKKVDEEVKKDKDGKVS